MPRPMSNDIHPFTGRDVETLDAELDRVLPVWFPEIDGIQHQSNPGRRFLSVIEGIIEGLNFSIDQAFNESYLLSAKIRQNAVLAARGRGYKAHDYTASLVDLLLTSLSGPVSQDLVIAPYTIFLSKGSPPVKFLTLDSARIAQNEQTVYVSAVQGERVVDEDLGLSDGSAYQRFRLARTQVDYRYVTVRVDNTAWDYSESGLTDDDADAQVFNIEFDDRHHCDIVFGNDIRGAIPNAGTRVTVDYVVTDGEDGNLNPGYINQVFGSLASQISCTNLSKSAGGNNGETLESIQANASNSESRRETVVSLTDYVTRAEADARVHTAYASSVDGVSASIVVMPVGGGVAASQLLADLSYDLSRRTLLGTSLDTDSTQIAAIMATIAVTLNTSKVPKNIIRGQILDALREKLRWNVVKAGKGPSISEWGAVIERDIANAANVDSVSMSLFTRKPRVSTSFTTAEALVQPIFVNIGGAPDTTYNWVRAGMVWLSSNTLAGQVTCTLYDTTHFEVSVYGEASTNAYDGSNMGEIGVPFLDEKRQVFFQIGVTGETFTVPPMGFGYSQGQVQGYTFNTSPKLANVTIGAYEIPTLEYVTDIQISILYPDEA